MTGTAYKMLPRLKGAQAVILTEDEVASLHVALGEWLEERR